MCCTCVLVGAAPTDHRLLHGPGRIFMQAGAGFEGGTDSGAPRLAQLERAVCIATDEHPLDGNFTGLVGPARPPRVCPRRCSARRSWQFARPGMDAAAGHVPGPNAVGIQHTVTRDPGTGIDTENAEPCHSRHGLKDWQGSPRRFRHWNRHSGRRPGLRASPAS